MVTRIRMLIVKEHRCITATLCISQGGSSGRYITQMSHGMTLTRVAQPCNWSLQLLIRAKWYLRQLTYPYFTSWKWERVDHPGFNTSLITRDWQNGEFIFYHTFSDWSASTDSPLSPQFPLAEKELCLSVCLSVHLSICLCSLFEETYHGNVKHDAELVPKQFWTDRVRSLTLI